MKKLKLAALLLATALTSVYVAAEVDVMQIILKDGSTAQYNVSQINGISFEYLNRDISDREVGGHLAVDLGLPSGLRWASCNIGADNAYEAGNYYAWGETAVKSSYTTGNSLTYAKTAAELKANGIIDSEDCLSPANDVATAEWGSAWRMPTQAEMEELHDNCVWVRITREGQNGYVVISKINGNSIFFPACGYRYNSNQPATARGEYWVSTPNTFNNNYAYCSIQYSNKIYCTTENRYYGVSVRAVTEEIDDSHLARPRDINAGVDNGSVLVTWGAVSSATSYAVYRSSNDYDYSQIGTSNTNSYSDANPSNGLNYYKVQALSSGATSRLSVSTAGIYFDNNEHEAVDLGLPSGLKWASCNIGAANPEAYGDYFAWGESVPQSNYTSDLCALYNITNTNLKSQGVLDNDGNLTPQYDTASKIWGSDWRMPTYNEFTELTNTNYCTWTWTRQNGVNGYLVTSKINGKSIFLPAAGQKTSYVSGDGNYLYYYTSSTGYVSATHTTNFSSGYTGMSTKDRYIGLAIRPVTEVVQDKVLTTPENLAGNAFEGYISITWSEVDRATSYTIFRSTNGTDFSQIGTSDTNSFIDYSPNAGLNYYRVQAFGAPGFQSEQSASSQPVKYNIVGSHAAVDLGLPSGILWATCNIAASNYTDSGNYYAWGETTARSVHTETSCDWYGLDNKTLLGRGVIDTQGNLTSQYDAATANWGSSWRMPTSAEMQELVSNCTWTWTTVNGVVAAKVTGTNGNFIYLPAAGARETDVVNSGTHCLYWTSTPTGDNVNKSDRLRYYSNELANSGKERGWGFTIRAVTEVADATKLATPRNVRAAAFDGEITVTWDAVDGAESYKVFRSTTGSGFSQIGTSTTSYYIDSAPASGTNYYRVQAIASGKESGYSVSSMAATTAHEYVDLGLPSGLLWAACNMGASKPSDYGDYYGWGETSTKQLYDATTRPYRLYTYELENDGFVVNGIYLPQYDAATVNWGDAWHIPSGAEFTELVNNCSWTWTTIDGHNGYRVVGPNGNSIFLPAASICSGNINDLAAGPYTEGYYWSSSTIGSRWDYDSGVLYIAYTDSKHEVRGIGRDPGTVLRPVTMMADINIMGQPVNLEGSFADNCITLTWDAVSGATSYALFRSTDGTNFTQVGTVSSNSYIDNSPAPGRNYYCVKAFGDKAPGRKSAVLEVNTHSAGGYDYVDLGLPSGLLWAETNIGAAAPGHYGNYYGWGETAVKGTYNIFQGTWAGKTSEQLIAQGVIDADGNLTALYDAATVNMGNEWRMPTFDEFAELLLCCSMEWTTADGVNATTVSGVKITGPNGNSIFIPAAGNPHGYQGEHCRYWGATSNMIDDAAMALFMGETNHFTTKDLYGTGLPVRAVTEKVDANSLATPKNVKATAVGSTVSLAWNAVTGATSYAIYRSTNGIDFTQAGTVSSAAYIDNAPHVGINYYRVQAIASGKQSKMSAPSRPVNMSQIMTHDCVDLGLPSGIKWATCNVGAENPSDLGEYFSWGETVQKPVINDTNGSFTYAEGYQLRDRGVIDAAGHLMPEFDVATTRWGGAWRYPTSIEMQELMDNCTWTWTSVDGRPGYVVTGPNDNSIFLPASGVRINSSFDETIYNAKYWTSSPSSDNASYRLNGTSSGKNLTGGKRYYAECVRPVTEYSGVSLAAPANVQTVESNGVVTLTWDPINGATSYVILYSTDGATYSEKAVATTNSFADGYTVTGANYYMVQALGENDAVSCKSSVMKVDILTVNGHEMVDLGLPSGLKWATCNIGATSPTDFGNYYAWGETETKERYSSATGVMYDKSAADLMAQGVLDSQYQLTAEYDAANANWGDLWRVPTKTDVEELINNCNWTWTTQNGVPGYLVASKTNDNSIFLPAAGFFNETAATYYNTYCYYMAARYYTGSQAYRMFGSSSSRNCSYTYNYYGYTVRPVMPADRTLEATENIKGIGENGKVSLTWNAVRGAVSYTIFRSVDNENFTEIGTSETHSYEDLMPPTNTYYYRIQAVDRNNTAGQMSVSSDAISIDSDCVVDFHEYVDLGLPSGLKWATCNIGAELAGQIGDYYAWGESRTKTDYNQRNSMWYNKTLSELQSAGVVDSNGNMTVKYDPASLLWGNNWRMPTQAEIQELAQYCTFTYETHNGVYCTKITGPSGKSIYMPRTGFYDGTNLSNSSIYGYNMSASVHTTDAEDAYVATSSSDINLSQIGRYRGVNIRPVISAKPAITLAAPGNVAVGLNASNRVEVSWTHVGDINSYEIFRRTPGQSAFTYIGSTSGSNYFDNNPITGVAIYCVRATYGSVTGPLSAEATYVNTNNKEYNGHVAVDLGLPSGRRWADCNVGASTPTGYGDFYAWGETTTRSTYRSEDYPFYSRRNSELLKANVIDSEYNLQPAYDVATTLWGESWRMPTKDEMQELVDYCTWTWTEQEGINGYLVTGPNGNAIFMPAGGDYYSDLSGLGSSCYYLTATSHPAPDGYSRYYLTAYSSSSPSIGNYYSGGMKVRPVVNLTDKKPLSKPRNVGGVADTSAGTITVTWDAVSDAAEYIVYRSVDGVNYSSVGTTTTNSYVDTRPGNGADFYQVRASKSDARYIYYSDFSAPSKPVLYLGTPGREYADFLLSSGNRWARYNLGATEMTDPGDYYAWGETEPKETYYTSNYVFQNKTFNALVSLGIYDSGLVAEYDAATVVKGSEWHMPTRSDFEELINKCTWIWIDQDDATGFVIRTNRDYIFLPACGYYNGNELRTNYNYYFTTDDYNAYYVGSTLSVSKRVISLQPSGPDFNLSAPSYGLPLRPVKKLSN